MDERTYLWVTLFGDGDLPPELRQPRRVPFKLEGGTLRLVAEESPTWEYHGGWWRRRWRRRWRWRWPQVTIRGIRLRLAGEEQSLGGGPLDLPMAVWPGDTFRLEDIAIWVSSLEPVNEALQSVAKPDQKEKRRWLRRSPFSK